MCLWTSLWGIKCCLLEVLKFLKKKKNVTETPPNAAIKNRGIGPLSEPKETLLQTFIIQKPRHT